MAEPLANGLDPRKKLYSALVGGSDKELASEVKKFSYNKFNGLLDNNDFVRDLFMDISERGIVLDPKNPNASKDPVEFANAFIYREPIAKPQPQAAPKQEFLEVPSLEEQEAYTPPAQPLVGSPEYDVKLQKQYGGIAPTLGATFGGVPASFETKAQKKQEQISPAFKAQQLAFEDVPIAEEQRKAQRQFAKATKQEKEAALRGGTGFEIQQKRANEQREATQKLKDFGSSLGVTFDNMINKVKAAEAMFGAKQRALLTFGEKGKKAEEQEKKVKQQVLGYLDQVDQDFAAKQAEYNIEGNIYDVISKGQLDRLPEAFAYNLAQIGINALGAGTTGGYSTFAQVVPDMYKAGVEEIARKTNTTPEEVIASGKDKEVIAYTAGAISGGIDYFSSGLLGQAMRSKGAYKYLRDLALNKIGKTKWKQAAASAAALGGVANIEGLTEGAEGLIEVAAPQVASAKSFKEARENIYGELQKPSTQRRLASDIVGGAAGGGGLVAGGRGLERLAQGDFTYGDVRKTTQRADMDIVQTDNKIQERNKIAQAMEEAVKGNPEAEGQIRAQYQKRVNEAAPTDEEVLNAYEGLAALPETEEKNTIRENLEAYMAEKGIQPEAAGMEAGLGEGLRVPSPEEAPIIRTVNPQFPPPQATPEPVAPEVTPEPISPAEEPSLEESLLGIVPQEPVTEEAPVEEATPITPAEEVVAAAPEQVVPAEEVTPESKKEEIEKKGKDLEKRYNALQKRHKKELADLNKKEGKNYADGFDILNINEDSQDKSPRSKEAVVLAERHEKEFQELLQEQRSLQEMAEEVSYSNYDFSGKKSTLQKLKDAIGAVYRKDKDALEEGFMNSYEALDRANQVGGSNYVAHGMGKASISQAYNSLVELFTKGINPQRGGGKLYVAPLSGGISTGQTASGNAYMDGPFTLIANREHQGDITDISQVGGIIVNDGIATNEVISSLRDLFPNLVIESTSNTDKLVEQLNQKSEQQAAPVAQVEEVVAAAPVPKGRKKATPVTPTAPKVEKPQPKKEEPKKEEVFTIDTNGNIVKAEVLTKGETTSSVFINGKQGFRANRELFGTKEEAQKYIEATEEKPTTGTPQEGDAVEIAPQREGGSPRKMVFKDGEWKQNVGGEIVKVGPSVQGQAQEVFAGKTETKAEGTKPAEETMPTAEFTSKQESSASEEFDGTKKPSKIKMKTFDGKHGKGAFERMRNITDNFEDIMDGLSEKIKQDCL